MNKIQSLSIQIMNSKYRVIFTIFIYCIIYSLFYYDQIIVFCMTNENISTDADSKERIIRSLQRNVDILLQERDHLHNRNSSLIEENLDLCVDNLRLKTITDEQMERNNVLEAKNQQLKAELRTEKTANIKLTKDLIKMKIKLAEEKKRLSTTENLLELLGTSAESSDIAANKKRKI